MFRGGSHGLLGEEKKPKLSPPVSKELEFDGTGDESWAVTKRRRFQLWQGYRIPAKFRQRNKERHDYEIERERYERSM